MSDIFIDASDPHAAMAKFKQETTPEDICKDQRAQFLIPLMKESYSIGYDEEPQYGRIIFMMENELLNMNCIPDKYFTWFQRSFIGRPISDFRYIDNPSAKIDLGDLEEFENSDDEEAQRNIREMKTKNKRELDANARDI